MVQTRNRIHTGTLSLLSILLLSACGGGGGGIADGGDSWSLNPAGAVSYSAAATHFQGPISGLGSIVVNGVRFETTGASIYDPDSFDDSTPFGSDLAMGMTVALMGDADESQHLGRASRVRVVGGVRGTLTPSVDMSVLNHTLAFPTQTVSFTDATLFSGTVGSTSINSATQLSALTSPVLLNVYGLMQSDNSFLATRVVLIDPSTHDLDLAVRGKVTAIIGNSYTVATGAATSVTVDCTSCTIQPTGNTPAVNDAVRVLATDGNSFNPGTSTLTGSRMQLVDAIRLARFGGVASGFAKIKGAATQVASDWYVADVLVTGFSNFVAGQFYEVKGTWSGNTLVATVVEQEGHDEIVDGSGNNHNYGNELYGAVSQLSGSSMTVQGITVDVSSAYFKRGSLASLANGQFVEIKGTLNANGVLMAIQVEVKSSSNGSDDGQGRYFEIKGVVGQWMGAGQVFSITDRSGAVLTARPRTSTVYKSNLLPSNGSRVEIKGFMNTVGEFEVIKLEVKSGHNGHSDD